MKTHLHHIVPKHMGGTNEISNLIELTIEEHAQAHKKLWEKYGYVQDKIAWLALSGQIGREEARLLAINAYYNKPGVRETRRQRKLNSGRGWIITHNECVIEVLNLQAFCRNNKLNPDLMRRQASGERKIPHKGFTCRYKYT